jgi:ATP-binding cassette subfamily B protein
MSTFSFILKAAYPYRAYILGNLLVTIIVAIDANLRPYIVKLLIDSVANSNVQSIINIGAIYALLQITIVAVWSFSDWCLIKYVSPFRSFIILLLTERVNKFPYNFFQNNLTGSIVAKMNDVANLIPTIVFTIIYQFILFTLSVIASLILLARIHVILALVMVAWIFLFLWRTYNSLQKVNQLNADYAESKSKIWGYISDFLTNILNVKCFSHEDYEKNKLHSITSDFIHKARRQGTFFMKFYTMQGCFVSLYTIAFLASLIYLQSNNFITPGDIALVFILNLKIIDTLYGLSNHLRDFTINCATVKQALSFFEHPIEIKNVVRPEQINIQQGKIEFKKVSFHYKDGESLFKNLNLVIQPGQKVGLVGYSGSGKSTFVSLILRLYEVTSGCIKVDDCDIRNFTESSLRAQISFVNQSPTMFHRTLKENISYGRVDAADDQIIDAAIKAHVHDFILQLPKKYNSSVGERGVKLSGGQLQRIAIARAILKNAAIIILDEATSYLDTVTESKIQDSLKNLMQGKTTIMIAHRLSTLVHMDRILVFDQGTIVQDGTHQELIKQEGLYKTLWEKQVNGFIPQDKHNIL